MANNKQAEKRNRQKERHRVRNRTLMGAMRTAVKKARAAVSGGDTTGALVKEAVRCLDKAATKGIIKKQTAARLVSRLSRMKMGTRAPSP